MRQGGWKKLVEAAYFKAVNNGVTAMYNGADWSVMYYQIAAMATDPCYASVYVELEVDGETKMAVTSADLIAAPSAICDNMRPQTIDVPSLYQLTDYLHQVEAKYGLYQKMKGSSNR